MADVPEMGDDTREVITDAFRIVDSLTEEQRKNLLVLFLSNLLKSDPEKAMNYVVKVREHE